MPGIGGLETLKRIRSSKDKDVPVWILTADASEKAKQDCKKRGANGLLVKPARPEDVLKVLEKYLKRL
jgi:CheY-like chemotaxis protein